MTTSRGLLPPETIITLDDLLEMSAVPIDPGDARYRKPLCRDARALARVLPAGSQIVLLGSIASGKYVDPLLEIFGANLLFPQQFVGRGDMSRGGLLLRADVTRVTVAPSAPLAEPGLETQQRVIRVLRHAAAEMELAVALRLGPPRGLDDEQVADADVAVTRERASVVVIAYLADHAAD